jgi:hypothetical protein
MFFDRVICAKVINFCTRCHSRPNASLTEKNFSDILTNQISPFVYSKDMTQRFRQGKITELKKIIIFHFIGFANQISKSYFRGINLKKRQLFQIKLIVLLN